MNDSFDKELQQRLSRDPFPEGGFDARLKRRIEERLEGSPGRPGRAGPVWRWPAAALVSISALLMAVWMWGSQNGGSGDRAESLAADAVTKPHAFVSAPAEAGGAKKYALLLGLRTDTESEAGIPSSEYRTLLVAGDRRPDQLNLMAELPDLYMPYGQNFWQIASVDMPEGRQTLLAIQATNVKSPARPRTAVIPDTLLSERVVYAGNAYLSIHSVYMDEKGGTTDIRRVKHIDQLNVKADHPGNDTYTSPAEFFPDVDEGLQEWIIYRNPGEWVSELNDPQSGQSQELSGLPEAIVPHDRLNMSWNEILSIEPSARDAFTYGNILGIVADQEIQVYAMNGRVPVSEPVRIPLAKGESVVMIQWAQNDKMDYVEKWIQDLRTLAGNG